MAEMLHISGGFLAALDEYVQAVVDTVPDAEDAGMETLQQDLQIRAALHPRWQDLAAHIETWWDRGQIQVGVRQPDKVAAAQRAEYGDAEAGPVPLIRHMPGSAQSAADTMTAVLQSKLGTSS